MPQEKEYYQALNKLQMKKIAILFAGLFLLQTSNAQTVKNTSKNKSKTNSLTSDKNVEASKKPEQENVFAQDCDPEMLRQKPGIWKEGLKGSIKNVTPTDLAKERAVLATIHNMLFTNYKPMGNQSQYGTVFGKYVVSGENWLADPYYYSMYVLRYLCDPNVKNKYYTETHTATKVTISANVYFPIDLYPLLPVSGPRGYLGLKTMPVKKNGYFFMGEEVVSEPGEFKMKEIRWLITYDDALPFVCLTRKEYLLIQKKRIEEEIKNNSSSKEYYSPYLNNIDNYLKKSDAELNKIAIYNPQEEERFKEFMKEGDKYSLIAVQPDPAYYNKKLPMSSPQFFSVEYKVSESSPIYTDNMEAIIKAVDFAKLKSMLGK